MVQDVPNMCVSRNVFLKHQVNYNTVLWNTVVITLGPVNLVEVLNEHLFLLVGCYVPTKVIRVRNKDKAWFYDQCSRSFGLKQEVQLRWTRDRSRVTWEEFVHCPVRANETYSEAKRHYYYYY